MATDSEIKKVMAELGRRGGAKTSKRKTASGARNLEKARKALAKKRLDAKGKRNER
jgi:hypothetical protein